MNLGHIPVLLDKHLRHKRKPREHHQRHTTRPPNSPPQRSAQRILSPTRHAQAQKKLNGANHEPEKDNEDEDEYEHRAILIYSKYDVN